MPKKEELKKKKVIQLSESLKKNFPSDFSEFIASQRIFKGELTLKKNIITLYYSNSNEPLLFEIEGNVVPTLQSIRKFPNLLPKITVDAGAVKFMINGADLFRPGIVEFEEFEKGQFVTVINLQKAAMCVGKTLFDSLHLPDKGKITQTVHHLNDDIWNFGSS